MEGSINRLQSRAREKAETSLSMRSFALMEMKLTESQAGMIVFEAYSRDAIGC